jgi:CRP-like cAMP-binding protein
LAGDAADENQVLQRLPVHELDRLAPHLESVHLAAKEVLFRAHEPLRFVYFPTTAVVSFVSQLESGETLEVGLVGRDGIVGIAALPSLGTMPCEGVVQIGGHAWRLSVDILQREAALNHELQSLIARFAQVLLGRGMRMSTCNMFHEVEQRCIRWLLAVHDLTAASEIPLTHEVLATMLGVHRPTVTVVLRSLHKSGLVHEERGRIMLRNRAGLETAVCECYLAIREEQRRLLGY